MPSSGAAEPGVAPGRGRVASGNSRARGWFFGAPGRRSRAADPCRAMFAGTAVAQAHGMIGLLPVLLLHLTIAAPALSDPAPQVPLAVTGAWTGEVDVSVDSAKTPTPVCLLLFITSNGQVHGVIGDATLLNARIEPGRGVV